MPRRENYLQENYGRYWKSMGTLYNVCRYAAPLYVIIVIFRKRILIEKKYRRSQTLKHRHSKQYTMLVNFQAEKLQSI